MWFQNRRAKFRRREKLDASDNHNEKEEDTLTAADSTCSSIPTTSFFNQITPDTSLFQPKLGQWMGYKLWTAENFVSARNPYIVPGNFQVDGSIGTHGIQDVFLQPANIAAGWP